MLRLPILASTKLSPLQYLHIPNPVRKDARTIHEREYAMAKRHIGIRHRIKVTTAGEAKPTQVAIRKNGEVTLLELPDEQSELDFLLGRFPVSYRAVLPEDDLTRFAHHHVVWKEAKEKEGVPEQFLRTEGKKVFVAVKVPEEFEGIWNGDTVCMALGGSGDYLAYALARRAESLPGVRIIRIPPFALPSDRKKDDDASLLAELGESKPLLFYETGVRDRDLIWLRECFRTRQDTMKARIACEQRLRQRIVGSIFCSPEGHYPEGGIEKFFDEKKANDGVLQALMKEERIAERELAKALEKLPVYTEILSPIEGCGPAIASRIIASVIDIRRFKTDAKLKAFMGVHVLPDGRFPRKRLGEVANWHNDARQALYLLGDQFNRRPDSVWGKYLRTMKANQRAKHPEVEVVEGKKRYTDAHIHKMALWRTLSRFVEALHRDWWKLEGKRIAKEFKQAA